MKDAFSSPSAFPGCQTAKNGVSEHPAPPSFERLPIPVHSMGPDGLLLEVNEAWTDYTGYSRARAIGSSFADYLDPPSARRTCHRRILCGFVQECVSVNRQCWGLHRQKSMFARTHKQRLTMMGD